MLDNNKEEDKDNNRFYVYCHQKKDDGKCFYIGKGKGNRAYSKFHRNLHWINTVKKHGGFDVVILVNNISEEKAFELEKDFIKQIGIKNLCNMTEGGDGVSGYKWNNQSREKRRELYTGIKNPFHGKTHSEETRKSLRNSCRKIIQIVQIDKDTLEIIKIWDCGQDVKRTLKISGSNICQCCKGKVKTAGGFIWRYYSEIDDKDLVIEIESVNTV